MTTHLAPLPQPVETLYLVVLTNPEHSPRGLFIEAPTPEIADAMGRQQYAVLTGCPPSDCVCRVTAYADLPEIMFGDAFIPRPVDQ